MKNFIFSMLILSAVSAQAVRYQENTELPLELRAKSTVAVLTQCPFLSEIKEESTTLFQDYIDQGVIDYYYTTRLSAAACLDQSVCRPYAVMVKSAVYSFSNPLAGDNTVVESVECSASN